MRPQLKPKTAATAAVDVRLGLAMLLAAALGWWLFGWAAAPTPPARVPPPEPKPPSAAVSKADPPPQPSPVPDGLPKVIQPHARTPMLNLADPRWKEYEAKRRLDPAWEWKVPIEFFGKVIDENNQPVAGATIECAWSGTPEKYGGDGVGHRTLTSDSSGLFSLTGVEGKGMTVHVSKEGYYRRSASNGWFEYAGFWEPSFIEPDRSRPVLFHLVKRPEAEPTYHVGFRALPKPPAWETQINFLAQPAETAAGGDVALQISRPPSPGYQRPFDWQLKIEGRGGAEVILSDEEFLLRAPEQGYQKAIVKHYPQVRGNSVETVKFYVRNPARKFYAAVTVEVTPYYPRPATKEDTACYIVTATVNPNDSPNVAYDPEQDIRERARRE